MEGTSEIFVRLPVKMKQWLAEYAVRHGMTMKDVVMLALSDYQDRYDPQEMRPRGK